MTQISNVSALTQIYQAQAKAAQEEQTQAQNKNANFGPAIEFDLSDDALTLLAQEQANFVELSPDNQKKLNSLFDEIDKIFEAAGEKALSKEQKEQVKTLEKQIDKILGPVTAEGDLFGDLSEEAQQQLDTLFDQIDAIFEKAGDAPLTSEQEKQLEALEKKVDGILGPVDEEYDPFEGLSDEAIKQLNLLFDQVDKIFETAGEKELSGEQDKQLELLTEKITKILE